jgi:hypothetical protein
MTKLNDILEKYSRWQPLAEYVTRIEHFQSIDFPLCIENSKALLESIAKEICKEKKQPLTGHESIGKLLGLSFGCLGYAPTDTIRQIATAISNIGQQMGNFRNEIGITAHGKNLEELKNKKTNIEGLTGEFLITSTETTCCFLIETFEIENPLVKSEIIISYNDNTEFNSYWDESYGNILIAPDVVYTASEILYNLDYSTYQQAVLEYNSSDNESD